MNILKKIPIPVCGLSLSIACLGNLILPYSNIIYNICGIISFLIILMFTTKIIVHWKSFLVELENPIAFSSLPTYTMTIILLTTYVKPYIGMIAFYIWIVALILQFIIFILFIKRYVLKFNIKSVFPSWFLISVGYVVASVTSPSIGMKPLGEIIFYFGFVGYFLTLGIVIYRVIKIRQIPQIALPTISIFSAPMSLCLAGYISAFEEKNVILVLIMLGICLISYVIVLIAIVWKLIKINFYPTFSAFTFPLVITAVAIKMSNTFLKSINFISFDFLQSISLLIAVMAVVFVLYKYLLFWFINDSN